MKETLKRELNKTYLILTSEDKSYEESYEIEMIIKNEPERILPLHVLRLDGELQLFFEVSSMQSLKDCAMRRKLSAETIRLMFESVEQLMKDVTDYLLDMECVMLDLAHIYTREGAFYFCYCPWERKDVLSSFREMLEEILENLDYHDTKGVELAYHLYQNACKGNFSIKEILQEHCKCEEKEVDEELETYFAAMENRVEEPAVYLEEKKEEKIGIIKRVLQFFLKKEKKNAREKEVPAEFVLEENKKEYTWEERDSKPVVEETFETYEGNTMLLQNMPMGWWRLRPLLPGYEEFCIMGESFLIGKKRDRVDGYIGRDTISRIHSRLMVRNGSLYIADANSTNGTFVNGETVLPGKEVEILSGDRILFADVEYECYNSL